MLLMPGPVTTAVERDVLSALIVDDCPDIRTLLRMVLEKDGDILVVAEAENGLEGVEAAGRCQPDLVLLDLAMPVMDGLVATPLVRRACPGARIVMLSGCGAVTLADRAVRAGADDYLQKGASPADIRAHLRALTTGRPA